MAIDPIVNGSRSLIKGCSGKGEKI